MDDDAVDRLYGLDLADFIAERDALAKQLRADEDREGAAEVKALAKPTRAAWVVNRLARVEAAGVTALGKAADALAAAQEDALSGGGGKAMRKPMEAARSATDDLLAAIPDGESEATREAVRLTLQAAVIDPDARAAVVAGRLTRELEGAGFGGVGSAAPAQRARPSSGARSKAGAKPGEDGDEAAGQRGGGAAKEDAAKTGGAKRGVAKEGAAKTGGAKRGAAKQDAAKTGAAKEGATKTGSAQQGAAKRGATKTGAAKTGGPTKAEAAAARKEERRQARLRDAEAAVAEAGEELDLAAQARDAAQNEADAARATHDEAREAVEAARKAVEDAEAAEREARKAVRAAEAEEQARTRDADRAEKRLETAREKRDDLEA